MTDWIPLLVALVPILSWILREIVDNRKDNRKMRRLIFRAEIRDLYREYIARGWIRVDELGEFAELVDAYHDAGGNGVATKMSDEIHKLEVRTC